MEGAVINQSNTSLIRCLTTIAIVASAISIPGFAAQTVPEDRNATGQMVSRKMDFKTGRFRRSYRLYVPAILDKEKPVPLLVVIHGAFSRPRLIQKRSGFNDLADREGFLVLYPKGIGLGPLFRHWNAGHCCGKAAADGLDDVAYVAAAIDDVAKNHAVDRSRIYMTGFSNGAMFTYYFAARCSHVVAAIAPVSGSIGGKADDDTPLWMPPKPSGAVPMIIFHGKADQHVPFEGGRSPLNRGPREYVGVRACVSFWASHNDCRSPPEASVLFDGRVSFERYRNRNGASIMEVYAIEDWAHDWPGPIFTNELPEDDPFKGFDAAPRIWDFLRRHRRTLP